MPDIKSLTANRPDESTSAALQDALPGAYPLTEQAIEDYRRDGFVQVDDVLSAAEVEALRRVVADAVAEESAAQPKKETGSDGVYAGIFNQKVNLWDRHPEIARFALSRRLGDIAAKLEGRAMRVWHDQALFKAPNQDPGNPTPWHQDAPYWPHEQRTHSTSIWIALRDATPENGCMTFVPGSNEAGPLEPINLGLGSKHRPNLLDRAPQYKGVKGQTRPLKAGSATFHNGLTFHYAGANQSDATREAFVVIYMPDGTRYTGQTHGVTDPLGLQVGDRLDGPLFPITGTPD